MRSTALMLVILSGAMVSAACSRNSAPPSTERAPAPGAASAQTASADPLVIAADLPRLPDGAMGAPRPFETVKAAYEFAARHPEVISYVPCFCGCERGGHKSNESCFVASRHQGKITWDNHGISCTVCLDVAIDAMQMHNAGATVAQLRDVIEKKYAPFFPGHTPTPAAPRGSGSHH